MLDSNKTGETLMLLQLHKWGNGTGIRFTKELMERAGIAANDTLDAQIENGQIVLTPVFRHKSLKERAAEFGGELHLSDEMPREANVGNEVW